MSLNSTNLKIVTYNIHKGFTVANVNFVLAKMRDALRSLDADLLFLQEIQGEHQGKLENIKDWPKEPQFEFLADQVWPHRAYGKNAIYQKGHHGNAILSKYPFQSQDNINLSKLPQFSRSLLHGVIELPAPLPKLHVICIHLAMTKWGKSLELPILEKRLKDYVGDDEPLILAGDFNDWRGHAQDFFDGQCELKEAFVETQGRTAKSFPSWLPLLPLDRIYFRNLQVHDAKCLKSESWTRLSDHLPLYAEFSF